MYRSVSTGIWTDDIFLGLSPEQKLLFLFLHTNPYASPCGIYRMQTRTMGFQIGLTGDSFESAMRGLEAAIPDFVMIDWDTSEVALLQYPKQVLITASKKVLNHVDLEIQKVNSQVLLRELISRNSASISKPYLQHLRRLQMQKINEGKFHGDVLKLVDNQEEVRKREIEREIEINSLSSANDFPSCSDRVTASLSLIETEIRENSEVLGEHLSKQDRDYVLNEIPKWLKYHAKREGFFDDPIGNLQYGPYSLERWVNGDRNKEKETREKTKNADYIAYLERAKMETPGTRSGKVIPLNEKEYTIFKKFIETNEAYAVRVEKFMSEVLSQINTPDDDSKISLGKVYNARAPFMRLPTIPEMEKILSDAASKNSVSLEENA